VPKVSAAKIKALFTTYIGVRQQREVFAKKEDEYKKQLAQIVETQGYTDDKGSEYIDFGEEIEGYAGLKRERRVNASLDEEKAFDILRKRNLYDACTTTITVVNEDAVRAAMFDGKLSQEDLDAMFSYKISYAFIPRKA
jgi:hypothetical protein